MEAPAAGPAHHFSFCQAAGCRLAGSWVQAGGQIGQKQQAVSPRHPAAVFCVVVWLGRAQLIAVLSLQNRELQIIRMMNHPNIVQLKHCFYTSTEKDEVYLNLVGQGKERGGVNGCRGVCRRAS
jgi:hypothetical protein